MQKKEKKIDSRIIRSKRDLANALEELLQEKNLDDISITEITDRAMVSKNTFYNNFTDKGDLLNFLFGRYSEMVETQMDKAIEENAGDKEKALHECCSIIVHFFYGSKLSFERIVKNDKSRTLYWSMNDFIKEIVKKLITKYSLFTDKTIPTNLLGYIYSGAFSNMIYYMYSEATKISEDDCIKYLNAILGKQIF